MHPTSSARLLKRTPPPTPDLRPEEQEQVRLIAYRLWEAAGRPPESDQEHWLLAEALFLAEKARRAAPPRGGRPPSAAPRAEEVALALLRGCLGVDRAFRAALRRAERLRAKLAALLGPDTADDTLTTLKRWRHDMPHPTKAALCGEVLRHRLGLRAWVASKRRAARKPVRPANGMGLVRPAQGKAMDTEVRKIREEGLRQFQQDLPGLLSTCAGLWVAYHGPHRVGQGKTKTRLLQECRAREFPFEELFVAMVQPEMPPAAATW